MSNGTVESYAKFLERKCDELEAERNTLKAELDDLGARFRTRGYLIEDLGAQLIEARLDRDRRRADHQSACETIAKMYAAATGVEGRAPIRGVVEDIEDVRAEYLRVCSERQHWVDVASQYLIQRDSAIASNAEQIRRNKALQLRVLDHEKHLRSAAKLGGEYRQTISDLQAELAKADEVNGELLVQVADLRNQGFKTIDIRFVPPGEDLECGYRLIHDDVRDPPGVFRLHNMTLVDPKTIVDKAPGKGGTVTVQVKLDTSDVEAKLAKLRERLEQVRNPLYILWSDPATW